MKMLNVEDLSDDDYQVIEKFVVSVYSSTCNADTVSEARQILFTQEN